MSSIVNATQCRKDLFSILDVAISTDERYIVTTKKGNAVIISEEAYNSLVETIYLLSDPTILDDIEEAERTHDEAVDWRICKTDIL
ncbi:MAG: type II toxin-antitoxin system Phd/YefM family antitoxin [Candidatus Methanomethylophilaceae archaeon]|nr:type II toxin-antitoxin system Phd/YefM family antitoxin [Candidatus Methanomethylophilaceae archaeon]